MSRRSSLYNSIRGEKWPSLERNSLLLRHARFLHSPHHNLTIPTPRKRLRRRTVLSGDTLTQKGVLQIGDLAPFIPGMNIYMASSRGSPQFTLRGIGLGSFNYNSTSPVSVYLDEYILDTAQA